MALLSVLEFPDPRLRLKAAPVLHFDASIQTLVKDMFETMYQEIGAGLAANQVNIQKRIVVIDVSDNRTEPLCLINPEIIKKEGTQFEYEGCLSLPGVYDKVERALKVSVKAQDENGKPITLDAEGLLAVCIQHEIDHLNGILFSDHLSKLKQDRLKRKLEKIRRVEVK